jgi:hypothetical protein
MLSRGLRGVRVSTELFPIIPVVSLHSVAPDGYWGLKDSISGHVHQRRYYSVWLTFMLLWQLNVMGIINLK